ncbi:MAG: fibronectin type III domain-containing protein [Candidatus Sulfotelmatobacter sp.]
MDDRRLATTAAIPVNEILVNETPASETIVHRSVREKPNTRFLLILVALAIATTVFIDCSRSPAVTQQSTDTKQAAASASDTPAGPLVCPVLGSTAALAPTEGKGGHRVILSWKASASADSNHSGAIGYCIYRRSERKDLPPQLLNSVPFPGTSCIDDFVENGSKYYYLVRAISAKGVSSITSNAAPARIPKRKPQSSAASSAPLCRAPAADK